MNRTEPAPTTRPRVPRASRTLLVAGAWLLAAAAAAGAVEPAGAPTPVLNLADGGVVPGDLAASDRPGTVRWRSAGFAGPFDFPVDGVGSVRFPAAGPTPRAVGAFGFELTGGDVLFGRLVGLDDKAAELDVSRLGRLRIDRGRIRRIRRWRDGDGLVYNGPNGLTGWREAKPLKTRAEPAARPGAAMVVNLGVFRGGIQAPAPPKPPAVEAPTAPPWREESGHLLTEKEGATLQGEVPLPARARIEFELSWKQAPDFLLAIGVGDDEKSASRAFRFEVWEGRLVALRETDKEGDLAEIGPIAAGPGRLRLQAFLDQERGRLLVYSAQGDPLADLRLGGRPGPGLAGVRLTNIRGDLRLERLQVGRWDGETPRPSGADPSRIRLADGSILRGEVDRLDADAREFVIRGESGPSRVAEDRVAEIQLSGPEDAAPRAVRAVYQDGTMIGGDWIQVEGGALILAVPGIAGPLRVPLEGIRSLEMAGRARRPPDKDPLTGTLEMDGLRMAGRLVDSGEGPGGSLRWQPLGGETASPIRPGTPGKIVYRTPAPRPATSRQPVRNLAFNGVVRPAPTAPGPGQPPASATGRRSLYLRTGDVIPAEVTRIDERGVTFRTDFSESTFVPNAKVKAVELAAESGPTTRLDKLKRERLLTLPRLQKGSPPTHLIRSRNGDILRGRLIAMDDQSIRVEVRLEEKVVPRDRVSRIIWLHADETDPSRPPAGPPGDAPAGRVQAVRSDGNRLTFDAQRLAGGTLSGKSDVLGPCTVRLQDLDQLLIAGAVEKEATQLAYQQWKLQNAPEPRSAQAEGGAAPGGAEGTESALVGRPAPDFELDLLGGQKFHLAEHKGRVIVLDFWATWCGPCLQAMPQIDRVTREFADRGVELVAVNLQEAPAKITAMLERHKLSPAVALDRDGVVAEKFGANAIPQTVVIDRDGKVSRLFIGGGPHLGDQLRGALQALMPADKP